MFLGYYRLREQPFGVTPDPRFLYMGPAQQEAFSSLVYGIETGRGFMALIASPGLGKTTIILKLMETLRDSARTAFLFQTHTTCREFLKNLIADLEVEPRSDDLGELQRQLGDLLIEEAKSGKRIVIVIDEAQNLTDEILEMVRMLSNYETPQAKLLQIVLVGQPQLADKLASPQLEQLRQRVSIITHFPPLTDNDVPRYIDHRLRVAGFEGRGLFTASALGLIARHSKGIPRNINNLCFQALSLGYAKNLQRIDDATLREVIADLSLDFLGMPSDVGAAANARAPIGRGEKPLLDQVDLSAFAFAENADSLGRLGTLAHGRTIGGVGKRNNGGPYVATALGAILVCLCMAPWIKPRLGSLSKEVTGRATGEESRESKSPPPPAVTATPRVQSSAPGSLSSPVDAPAHVDAQDNPQTPPDRDIAPASSPPDNANSAPPQIEPDNPDGPQQKLVNGHESLAAEESAYASGKAKLVVESSVSGARITVNGRSDPSWKTPKLFSFVPGTYIVSVARQGYEPWTQRVRVDEGAEKYVRAELQSDEGGIFTVDTTPAGMQVIIDGKSFGPSRVETVLRSGWHVCEVIPVPGAQGLVSRFHLDPGQAVTRKIRMGSTVVSEQNTPRLGRATGPAAVPPGGIR